MKTLFPYFGNKRSVASEVVRRLDTGSLKTYIEPFAGSAAVLLSITSPVSREILNDADALLSNFWRAVKLDGDAVQKHACIGDAVCETDLHARHLHLLAQKENVAAKLMGDPEWYDAKLAGWWVWGQRFSIAHWCTEAGGPWVSENGQMVKGEGYPSIRKIQPAHRRSNPRRGDFKSGDNIREVHQRLQNVFILCGDWSRAVGTATKEYAGPVGVFLDPPYPDGYVDYGSGNRDVWQDVQKWCIERGNDPWMRIALCGYEEHEIMADHDWTAYHWKAHGTGRLSSSNPDREVIWFSPHCISEPFQDPLF
jgi:DNA adenine methylase